MSISNDSVHSKQHDFPLPAQNFLFLAKLENLKSFIKVLKCVQIKEKDLATLNMTNKGIKVVVQDLGSFQAAAYLQKELFKQYECKENITFRIGLKALVECLGIFSGFAETTGQLLYKNVGEPLCLMLEELGHYTECNIKTVAADDILPFEFLAENLQCRIICKSDCIKDAFVDLFSFNVGTVEFFVSNNASYLSMKAESDNVLSEVTVNKDSDFVEAFQCKEDVRLRYRTTLMKAALKPLTISEKTSLRIDDHGVMALQFMIRSENDMICFVELYCLPEIDQEDDE